MIKKKLFGVGKKTSGIVAGATVNLDAGDSSSYSGSGTTWYDLSGNNYDATLVNGVGYDSGNDGVLTFDGVDDYVDGGSSYSVDSTNPFTVEVWFNLDDFSYLYPAVFNLNSSDMLKSYLFLTGTDVTYNINSLTFAFSTDTAFINGAFKTDTNTIIPLNWYQVVVTYNGNGLNNIANHKVYINSISVNLTTSSGAAVAVANNIGKLGPQMFDGKIPIFNLYNNKEFTQEEVTQNFNFYKDRYGLRVDDADAQAFIDAAVITDYTQQIAIDNLVKDLKGYGLWTKMKAIYPFVGGTADTHKWNLKDPRDLDAAFRITWSGGLTHDSNGVKGDGTNYGNTFLVPSTSLSTSSEHLSFYSNLDERTASRWEIGTWDLVSSQLDIQIRYDGTVPARTYLPNLDSPDTSNRFDDDVPTGFYLTSRTGTTLNKGYKNSVAKFTDTSASLPLPAYSIFVMGLNNGGSALRPTYRRGAFASIGDGLTDADASNLYTAVQAFQTTLGRQI